MPPVWGTISPPLHSRAALSEPEINVNTNSYGAEPAARGVGRRVAAQLWHLGGPVLARQQDQVSLWLPVLFGAGIAFYFARPVEPDGTAAAVVATICLAGAVLFRSRFAVFAPLLAIAAMCAGFAVADARTTAVMAPILERELRAVTVEGILMSKTARAQGGVRIVVQPIRVQRLDAADVPARLRINVRTPMDDVRPGDIISVRAGLMPPPGPAAPGAFDFGRQAFFRQIGGVGYAVGPLTLVAQARDDWRTRLAFSVARLRADLTARILDALPAPQGAVAAALMTGDRGGIPEDVLSNLRDAGLAHLLAISGLHMALFAGALFWLVRALLALSPWLVLNAPIKKWAAALALLGAFGYLLVSGGSVATQRAFVMFTLIFAAVILDRPAITMRNVALAAFIVLALTPESVMEASFQMSFAAATALVAFYEAARPWLARWNAQLAERGMAARAMLYLVGIGLTSIVASLATAPFAAYHFNRVVDFGLVANLAAMPVVAFAVMPAALAAFIAMPVGLEAVPLWVAGQGIASILWVADAVASWPGAITAIPSMPPAALVALVLGGLWLALWRGHLRWAGMAGLVAGVVLAAMTPRPVMLIEREAGLVAVRDAAGLLAMSSGRKATFSADVWLRRDADLRTQKQAYTDYFSCDSGGCVAAHAVLGIISAPRTWRALVEDCAQADLVITDMYAPRGCTAPRILDRGLLDARGAHAIFIDETADALSARTRLVSACDVTGDRPWTQCRAKRR